MKSKLLKGSIAVGSALFLLFLWMQGSQFGVVRARPADSPMYKVMVSQDGIYKLSYDDLRAAGLPVDTLDPRELKMYDNGQETAIQVFGEQDGSFDQGDFLLFYGHMLSSPYTCTNVYWLTYGGGNGRRMNVKDGSPGTATVPQFFTTTRHVEENHIYQSAIPWQRGADHWFWNYYSTRYSFSRNRTYNFSLTPDTSENYSATLHVRIIGDSSDPVNPDHHLKFYMNGTYVGERYWDGRSILETDIPFTGTLLTNGSNSMRMEAPADTGASSEERGYMDWFGVEYRHPFVAENNQLWFASPGTGTWKYEITGFLTVPVSIFDVTDPVSPAAFGGVQTTPDGSTYTASFQDTVGGRELYLAVTPDRFLTPDAIVRDTPSDWHTPNHGADYILITHRDFWDQVDPLLALRSSQGMRVVKVDVQDIYDEFNDGEISPLAIREFLQYAYYHWQAPAPHYVLLVGDGTYDFKDYTGNGTPNYIPPYMAFVDPFMGETASDNYYVNFTGDGAPPPTGPTMPKMAIGRLPADTPQDAQAMVEKTIAYETGTITGTWDARVTLVADDPDAAGNHPELTNRALNYIPPDYQVQKIYYLSDPQYDTYGKVQHAITEAINAGTAIVNYSGHGSYSLWGSEMWVLNDLNSLHNQGRYPIVLPMTCLEGYFVIPGTGHPSMGESMVRLPNAGAVASWSPTGLGIAHGHSMLQDGFYDAIFNRGVETVGDATIAGKQNLYDHSTSYLDLLDTYMLFGDPALRVRIAKPDLVIEKSAIPAYPSPGSAITYTLVYSNAGDAAAYTVTITDLVPLEVLAPSVTWSGATMTRTAGITYSWRVTNLVPGAGGVITITGVLTSGLHDEDWITNTAVITTTSLDANPDNNQSEAASQISLGNSTVVAHTFKDSNGDGQPSSGEENLSGVDVSILNHSGITIAQGTTDSTGRFTTTHLAAGTYTVTAGDYDGYISTTPETQDIAVGQGESKTAEFGYLSSTGVELVAFTAEVRGKTVALRWETLRERNVSQFIVTRGEKPKGPWVELSRVPSEAVGGTGANYKYVDKNVSPGRTYWYRLVTYPAGDVLGPTSVTIPQRSFRLFLPSIGNRKSGK